MIIEREGRKYYVDDNATSLDANGVWQGISADNLIPYDLYVLQKEKADLTAQIDIINSTTDEELILWARENNPMFQEQTNMENRVNELDLLINNFTI